MVIKKGVIGFLAIFASCQVLAQTAPANATSTAEMEQMAGKMDEIRSSATNLVGHDFLEAIPANAEAAAQKYEPITTEITSLNRDVLRQGASIAQEYGAADWEHAEQLGQLGPDGGIDGATIDGQGQDDDVRYRIFVTQNMSDQELKSLVEMYRGRDDVALVFRGLKPGQRITAIQGLVYRLLSPIKDEDSLPNITMDPEPFKELGTNQAPVIAAYGDDKKLQAYALGLTSVEYIAERVAKGQRGNLGSFGPTVKVVEEDMIERMMRDAQNYDWEGASAHAMDRFWARTPVYNMPRVSENREFELDPSFEITQDIVTPGGQFIAHAGDRVNPLETAPFNQMLLFFDPADPDQVKWVKGMASSHPDLLVSAMATQLQTFDGLDGLGKVRDDIGVRIFQLPKEVQEKFNIQRVPTSVRASGTNFLIKEHVPSNLD